MEFERKQRYGIEDLLHIMELLRSPEGCPWDREQTHQSIRSNLIEETYEAVEAIDTSDRALLQEELGDVLLQVVFHSQLEKEAGGFSFEDVADGISQKLILRHPHVFGTTEVNGTEDVLTNWDAIKKKSKAQETQTEVLQSVSRALPSLMRSAKIQHKAAKSGFDWPDISGALEKVSEETAELNEAVAAGDNTNCADELGDLLFSVVNVSRFLKLEPEQVLSQACDKFISRFARVEAAAKKRGLNMNTASPAELDKLWEEAKKDILSQPAVE